MLDELQQQRIAKVEELQERMMQQEHAEKEHLKELYNKPETLDKRLNRRRNRWFIG